MHLTAHKARDWRQWRLLGEVSQTDDRITMLVQAGRDFGFLSFSMTACFVGGTALLLV